MRHGGGSLNQAVVAAFDAAVMLVARNQQEGMTALFDNPATLRRAITGNLSTIINSFRQGQLEAGARGNEGVQVDHRAVLPQKRAPTS